MRPARVQQLLLDAAASLPGVSAKAFADAGHTRHPFGVVIEAEGRTSKWQVALMSAPGETWGAESDERAPVLGEKPPAMEIPALTNDVATVERALVAQLLAQDPGEIASVDLYSARPTPPAVGHGATIDFHDGSRAFLNHVR
ncbi:hypothetical protein ACIF6L_34145 [Kitasatospora sp. NPDC086009]|uniref:hypothetical protein n=1 Tax=unclassified Kitasatospora TaxID=2633591 RepID=UPI0037CC5E1B